MTTLTSSQADQIRAELTDARQALIAQIAVLTDTEATIVAARVSPEERAKSQGDADLLGVERNLVARQSQSFTQALDELDVALTRLADGTYGMCASCGQGIPPERLLARPRSTQCVGCAAKRSR